MKNTQTTLTAHWALLVALTAVSCTQEPESAQPQEGAAEVHNEKEESVDPSLIAVPPSVRSNLGITFVSVERRRVERTRRIPGQFEYLPSARSEYRAMLPGRIELLVKQFERVESGQPLFRVASPAWHELQQELSGAESTAEGIEAELGSYESLSAAHKEHEAKLLESITVLEGRVSKLEELGQVGGGRITELTEARAALATAKADLAGAQEKVAELELSKKMNEVRLRGIRTRESLLVQSISTLLDVDASEFVTVEGESGEKQERWRTLGALVVTASESGVVESLDVTDGTWAEERGLVLSVVQPELLRFHAMGLQSDLGLLRDGLSARIVPPAPTNVGRSIGLQDTMSGVVSLGLAADPQSRTVDLFVVPDTLSGWARPGVTAQLEITIDATDAPELAVPLAAVQQDGLEAVLFRRNPKKPNEVIRIQGDLGANDGRWVSVLSGLRDGDEVVLDGSFQLMLATTGSMQKGGHFHADGTFHEGEE